MTPSGSRATPAPFFAAIAPAVEAPAPSPIREGRPLLVAAIAATLVAVGALPRLLALVGRGGAGSFVAASGAMVALAWGGARLSATRLPPIAARPASMAGGLVQGFVAFGWIVLALAVGGRLTGGGAGTGAAASLALGAGLLAIQSAGEEVFFRGWVQGALRRLLPDAAALPIAAAVFALAHLLGGTRAPLTLVNLALVGLWYGLLARASGGLAMPIAAHWTSNALELLGLGIYPNPGVGPWGAWRDYDITGGAIWGGGPEGDNASVPTTLVVLGMILYAVARRRPRQAP